MVEDSTVEYIKVDSALGHPGFVCYIVRRLNEGATEYCMEYWKGPGEENFVQTGNNWINIYKNICFDFSKQ